MWPQPDILILYYGDSFTDIFLEQPQFMLLLLVLQT